MPNLEENVQHTIQSSLGTLDLNVEDPTTKRKFLIVPDGYKIVPAALRFTRDDLSQADGSVPHPPWRSGLVASFNVEYVIRDGGQDKAACAEDLREMHDLLMSHLDALTRVSDDFDNQRVFWVPSGDGYGVTAGGNQRMLTNVLTVSWPTPTPGTMGMRVLVELGSPFPYAIDSVQQLVSIADGGSDTITNPGSSDLRPVIKAYGPFTSFGITNTTTGEFIQYDGSRPGAAAVLSGHYVEIDMFRGTATLDGSVTFLDAGIDPATSDFWPLEKGDNLIEPIGADIDVLWNPAWA